MTMVTVSEVTRIFQSFGLHDCDDKLVQEWMNDTNIKITNKQLYRDNFFDFEHWYRRKGTAYEEGISDKIKIGRLFEEINTLKRKIAMLEKEKEDLKDQLGITPF